MTTINQTVFSECMTIVAGHYANKIEAAGFDATEEAVQDAVTSNWEKVSAEIAELYGKVMADLEDDAA